MSRTRYEERYCAFVDVLGFSELIGTIQNARTMREKAERAEEVRLLLKGVHGRYGLLQGHSSVGIDRRAGEAPVGIRHLQEDEVVPGRAPLRSVHLAQPRGEYHSGDTCPGEACQCQKLSPVDRSDLIEAELPELRQAGFNALVLPADAEALWLAAERLGFIVIGRA